MRRRVVPLVLTAAAGVVALLRRSRRRRPPSAPRYVAQPPATALPAPEIADDAAIAVETSDPTFEPHAQVEGEGSAWSADDALDAIHNVPGATGAGRGDDAGVSALPSTFRSVAWTRLDDEPSAEATELRIGFSLVARHESLARIDVRETSSQVFVTVLSRFEPPAGGWFAYAEAHKATVELNAPLGDRALVHAPVQEPSPPAVPPTGPSTDAPPDDPPADEPAG